MIEIRNVPPVTGTQLDRAPKPASRAQPEDVPSSKVLSNVLPSERRRNPDRRRRRAGKGPIDQRLGADRRRNRVDIEV